MAIDFVQVAVVLRRCSEIAAEASGTSIPVTYAEILKGPADIFLAAHEAVLVEERALAKEKAALVASLDALGPSYSSTLAVVKERVPKVALPDSFVGLTSVFDRALAVEALLNILDDSILEETWAVKEIAGPFGTSAPSVLRELGEAALLSPSFCGASDARARAYGPAFERLRVFKRAVRRVLGPQSGQYQSIHWRSAWGHEGAGPVSWGPFSFRAPFQTW